MSEIYERNINISVAELDTRRIKTKASLLDLNHNIRVELVVDLQTSVILDARADMVKAPFDICALTLNNMRRVAGLRVERGIQKKIADALGHAEGCTHLVDLTMEAVRLSANVLLGFTRFDAEWRERRMSDEEFIKQVKPVLKNSCLPFREDSQ